MRTVPAEMVSSHPPVFGDLPQSLRLYVLGILFLAAVVLPFALVQGILLVSSSANGAWIILQTALFAALVAIAQRTRIKLPNLPMFTLSGTIIIAVLLILPAPFAILAVFAGEVVAHEIYPDIVGYKRLFNEALSLLEVAGTEAVAGLIRPPATIFNTYQNFHTVLPYLVLLVVLGYGFSSLPTMVAIALEQSISFFVIVRESFDAAIAIWVAIEAFGVPVAALWHDSPVLCVFLVAPFAGLRIALTAVDASYRAAVLGRYSEQLQSILAAGERIRFKGHDRSELIRPIVEAARGVCEAETVSLYLTTASAHTLEEVLRLDAENRNILDVPSVFVPLEMREAVFKDGIITVPLILPEERETLGMIRLTGVVSDLMTGQELQALTILAGQAAICLDNARLHEEVVQRATHDPLTGLCNRRAFEDAIVREMERFRRYGVHVALITLDLDRFKSINDVHGHKMGDQALVAVAGALSASVRNVDMPARLGGDEFVVLMPETDVEEALIVAERICASVRGLEVRSEVGSAVPIACSVGVGVAPHHGTTVDELMQQSDAATYSAKRAGKDRVGLPESATYEVERVVGE